MTKALIEQGFTVLAPIGDDQPYDLVVHLPNDRFERIQCKVGWESNGCVRFNTCSTDHGRGRQDYRGRADVFGVYYAAMDRVYMIPVDASPTRTMHLRLSPARNNQRIGVQHADDYSIARWARATCGVAA